MDSQKVNNGISTMIAELNAELKEMVEIADKIVNPTDYLYYKSFPEFSTLACNIKGKSLSTVMVVMKHYFPRYYEDLNEVENIYEENDFQILNGMLSAIFSCVHSELSKIDTTDLSGGITSTVEPFPLFQSIGENKFEFLHYLSSVNMKKPQEGFVHKPDNQINGFRPDLREKHNAKVSFHYDDYFLIPSMYLLEDFSRQIGIDTENNELCTYMNPYAYEINHICYPKEEDCIPTVLSPYNAYDGAQCILIDTVEGLKDLIHVLLKESMIAFTVRNHSYHSFLGFIGAIGISTKEHDYVLDAIQLHDVMHDLNEVFSNERIMKVYAGDDKSLLYLQRDFAIYEVNLFSLYHASRVLSLPHTSFSFLLQHYCGMHQTLLSTRCDWRVRPFDNYMISDCCCDTHYMLYICDRMRKDIIENSPSDLNLIHDVLARSNESALHVYEKPLYSYEKGSWIIPKMGLMFSSIQKNVFLSLTYYRDIEARIEDESCEYILPLEIIIRCTYATPSLDAIPAIIALGSPKVQSYAGSIMEIIKQVTEVKADKMAVYAVIVEEICRKLNPNVEIKSSQEYLSDSCNISEVNFGRKNDGSVVHENEVLPTASPDVVLQRLINHGSFKHFSTGLNKEEGYLYYNPYSLPYNTKTPLRNSVPYIPLVFENDEMRISNVIPSEYVNTNIRNYVNDMNKKRTPAEKEEIKQIKEVLHVDRINKNLMMLGSVLEDDAISISSDDDSVLTSTLLSASLPTPTSEEYTPHYPPRTLKEIYSLPHKNRGDLKDGISVSSEDICGTVGIAPGEDIDQEEVEKLLEDHTYAEMNDMEFLDSIGWGVKAQELQKVFLQREAAASEMSERATGVLPYYANENKEEQNRGASQDNTSRGGKPYRSGKKYPGKLTRNSPNRS